MCIPARGCWAKLPFSVWVWALSQPTRIIQSTNQMRSESANQHIFFASRTSVDVTCSCQELWVVSTAGYGPSLPKTLRKVLWIVSCEWAWWKRVAVVDSPLPVGCSWILLDLLYCGHLTHFGRARGFANNEGWRGAQLFLESCHPIPSWWRCFLAGSWVVHDGPRGSKYLYVLNELDSFLACECVEHLNRCKTSNRCLLGFSRNVLFSKQGGNLMSAAESEEGCIHDWYDSVTLETRTCTICQFRDR